MFLLLIRGFPRCDSLSVRDLFNCSRVYPLKLLHLTLALLSCLLSLLFFVFPFLLLEKGYLELWDASTVELISETIQGQDHGLKPCEDGTFEVGYFCVRQIQAVEGRQDFLVLFIARVVRIFRLASSIYI